MDEKRKRKQIAKISVFITSVFVIFLSITYAFINMTVTGTKRQVITSGNLQIELEEDNAITIQNAMPMYDEVGMIQDAFNFRLVNKASEDTNYIVKLVDITDASKDKLDTSIVKYGLTKDGVSTIDLLSTLKDNQIDSGKISGNQTIEFSLRLWINSTVTENDSIKDKTLTYRINVEVSQDTGETKSIVFDTTAANLGENCSTYNDGTDTFLVGQCSKNYVWYSGKLWRVVLKNNETGAIKMVTDNNMTAISYNTDRNLSFENSYVDQWLQQEFLPTLHDYQSYLVINSIWDASIDSSSVPLRPTATTTVKRTVGLLNAYEYYVANNNSSEKINYLNNRTFWWTMTSDGISSVRLIGSSGDLKNSGSDNGNGVRPVINLNGIVQISSGNGTKDSPYRLEGDNQLLINGSTLLSTRYSGEYITFNNETYRIVETENQLTKIISVDIPDALSSAKFDSSTKSTTDFGLSSIRTYLETYYQNLDESEKNLIETNTIYYLGTVGQGKSYKASICQTVDANVGVKDCLKTKNTAVANIGLLRVGEMFTSQITDSTRKKFWLLTPNSTSDIRVIDTYSGLNMYSPSSNLGIRPSMYLKSNVVIASSNTGDGTYDHPYDIELGK